MSLGCVTSRPHHPWPKKRWVVREEVVTITADNGVTMSYTRTYEDYVLDWPWTQCRGVLSGVSNADYDEQIGLQPRAVRALEDVRSTYPD